MNDFISSSSKTHKRRGQPFIYPTHKGQERVLVPFSLGGLLCPWLSCEVASRRDRMDSWSMEPMVPLEGDGFLSWLVLEWDSKAGGW